MRCSKCGYISFDHLESCRKCHKPMADAGFKGTTCTVAVPSFLQLSEEKNIDALEENMVDILDPDLELLAEGDNEEIDFGAGMFETQDPASRGAAQSTGGEISFGDEFDIAFDAESKESDLSLGEEDLFLDTSRFESVPVSLQAMQAARPVQLEIPADLADISDLARPDRASGLRPDSKEEMTADLDADLDVDLDFADLDLADLDLPVAHQKKAAVPASLAEEDDFADLFLDDIELSGDLEVEAPQSSSPPVEDDLDFDLDLGALGSEKVKPQKKKSDDLADLELSLD